MKGVNRTNEERESERGGNKNGRTKKEQERKGNEWGEGAP